VKWAWVQEGAEEEEQEKGDRQRNAFVQHVDIALRISQACPAAR